MTMTGADTSQVVQADSPSPVRAQGPVGRVHPGGRNKLHLLRDRWSEFLSLLTPDFWLGFAAIFLHLTAVTMMAMLILLEGK